MSKLTRSNGWSEEETKALDKIILKSKDFADAQWKAKFPERSLSSIKAKRRQRIAALKEEGKISKDQYPISEKIEKSGVKSRRDLFNQIFGGINSTSSSSSSSSSTSSSTSPMEGRGTSSQSSYSNDQEEPRFITS